MYKLTIIELAKFKNVSNYKLIENKIYRDINDCEGFFTHRIAVSLHMNDFINLCHIQKRLEDFFIYIEEVLDFDKSNAKALILGGDFEDLQKFIRDYNLILRKL